MREQAVERVCGRARERAKEMARQKVWAREGDRAREVGHVAVVVVQVDAWPGRVDEHLSRAPGKGEWGCGG